LQVVKIKEDRKGAQNRTSIVLPFLSVAGLYTVDPLLKCGVHKRGEKDRGETEGVFLPSQLESTPQLGY
jgi:hypothetical protein